MALLDLPDQRTNFLSLMLVDNGSNVACAPTGHKSVTTTPALAYFTPSRIRGNNSLDARVNNNGSEVGSCSSTETAGLCD